MADIIEERKEKVLGFLKKHQTWLVYGILAVIILLAFFNRMAPLPNLIDSTTGDYIPIEIDSFVFLRYAQEILVNGTQAAVDTMRYYPDGYPNQGEFSLLAGFIVYLYKFLHFFDGSVTLGYADVIYPPLTFAISLLFFFLFVRRLFDYRVGLLATAFLAFIPTYVQRTIAGFSDKESFGMMFFFMALYFFVCAFFTESKRKALIYGIISGLCTAVMGKVWGGVRFLFLVVAFYILIEVIFNRINRTKGIAYSTWAITSLAVLMIIYPIRYNVTLLFSDLTVGLVMYILIINIIYYILDKYDPLRLHARFKEKVPIGLFSLGLAIIIGIVLITVFKGFDFIAHMIKDQVSFLKEPFAESRWALTVAESHQPYMRDFVNQVGKIFFSMFLAGTIAAFYHMLEPIKENKKKLTVFFVLFALAFALNRYSPDSVLNGSNLLSLFLFFGSFIFFFAFLLFVSLHVYRKRREHYQELVNLKGTLILALSIFFVTIVGARTMVRLIIVFSPILVIFVSYAFVSLFDYTMKQKHSVVRIALIVGILCLLLLPNISGSLTKMYKDTTDITERSGPIYTQQWQQAMAWVRNNTAPDTVFAHWWDYGYWVQTGGERATVSDGGNNGGEGINYNTARYLLTTPNEEDALAFMKARGATHALIVSEDIGKYPAFSSIGSDLQNDRNSWINVFSLDQRQSQEQKNQTLYVYTGGSTFDADVIYNDHFFQKFSAGVGAIIIPMSGGNDSQTTLSQPTAIVIHNNQQFSIPINCLVIQGKRIEFGKNGLDSCVAVIPSVQGNKLNPIGAALYLSKKVKDSFLARFYIYSEESQYFRVVYSDHEQIPLMLYNGRIIGPHKIWEAKFPPNIEVNETLRSSQLPDPRLHNVIP